MIKPHQQDIAIKTWKAKVERLRQPLGRLARAIAKDVLGAQGLNQAGFQAIAEESPALSA